MVFFSLLQADPLELCSRVLDWIATTRVDSIGKRKQAALAALRGETVDAAALLTKARPFRAGPRATISK